MTGPAGSTAYDPSQFLVTMNVGTGASGTGPSGSGPYVFQSHRIDRYGLGDLGDQVYDVNPHEGHVAGDPAQDAGGYLHPGKTSPGAKKTLFDSLTGEQLADNFVLGSMSDHGSNAYQSYLHLQKAMELAGYYGDSTTAADKIRHGGWTQKDSKAFHDMLSDFRADNEAAAKHGIAMDLNTWLDGIAGQAAVDGQGTPPGGPKQQYQLTDPAALAAQVQQAAHAGIGRSLTDQELQGFVGAFQGQQAAAGTSTDPAVTVPDANSQASNYVKGGALGQEYANYQAAGYTDTILNMFLPGASQRASATPAADSTILQ